MTDVISAIKIPECELLIHHIPRRGRCDPSALEILYSDDNIRIMRMHDVGYSPEKGMDVVRVDIFHD